tara:strand:+ start:43 stop:897 length:855 start_codon:yes stop_codon:yes gene_type:complete
MKYLIIKQSLLDPQLFMEENAYDDRFVYKELYDLHNISCIQVSAEMYGIHSKLWNGKYIEIEKDTAELGSTLFSEVRDTAKLWEISGLEGPGLTGNERQEVIDQYPETTAQKVPIDMNSTVGSMTIKEHVLTFMKAFAKEIIEDEFQKRFIAMRDTCELESASWEIQKHEAREWLTNNGANGSVTPFLDYLATERSEDKTALANKILQKAEAYQDKLSTMLVSMQKIKKEFKNSTSIKDINILYEDYLSVMMPTSQAIELGRTLSTIDWERKSEYEVKANEFNF